jgi:hypothetical protein
MNPLGKRPLVRDRKTALVLGLAAYVVGSRLIYDAYEARGVKAPWGIRWLPGA